MALGRAQRHTHAAPLTAQGIDAVDIAVLFHRIKTAVLETDPATAAGIPVDDGFVAGDERFAGVDLRIKQDVHVGASTSRSQTTLFWDRWARLAQTDVLPVPPLPLMTTISRMTGSFGERQHGIAQGFEPHPPFRRGCRDEASLCVRFGGGAIKGQLAEQGKALFRAIRTQCAVSLGIAGMAAGS